MKKIKDIIFSIFITLGKMIFTIAACPFIMLWVFFIVVKQLFIVNKNNIEQNLAKFYDKEK
tara:strand:- start:173 stop:355 length:183 start_codon:yes stop_codon:yes gene_type:complete